MSQKELFRQQLELVRFGETSGWLHKGVMFDSDVMNGLHLDARQFVQFIDPRTHNSVLHEAAYWGGRFALRVFSRRCDPNAQNYAGDTPLHLLCNEYQERYEDIYEWLEAGAQALVDNGANPNVKNHDGHTPVDLAEQQYAYHVAGYLRSLSSFKGAPFDPNSQDRNGNSPAHLLYEAFMNGALTDDNFVGAFRFLMSQGADFSLQNGDGQIPFPDRDLGGGEELPHSVGKHLRELGIWH